MTMPPYKNSKSIMTEACYKSGNDNNKFDNNKDKVRGSHIILYTRLHAR